LWYLNDALGSAVGLIEKDGRVSSRYHYDEFGIPTDAKKFDVNWPGPDNLFGYTGLGYDYYSGMSYARARYYKPELGRFISEDTYKGSLWNPQSQNGYAYVHNNPLRFIDPSGHITQEEMNMFESGKMAPAAHSYLMNLTYQWYLADDKESKDSFEYWANDFRKNNYLTTNGLFKDVDENIKFMSSLPTDELTEEQHYFRNKLNLHFSWDQFQKLQERLPDELKWKELPFSQAAFHKFTGINNRKYVSSDGHFELVYNKDNVLLNENNNPADMGTYNYYGPDDKENHTKYDVVPWLNWLNVPPVEPALKPWETNPPKGSYPANIQM
jgi:RHS repeat-associated protein